MKKFISALLLALFVFTPCVNAMQSTDVVAPKWEDYIPAKYQNPTAPDYTRGSAIAQFSVGIALIDTLILSPVGIPMTVVGTRKFRNLDYYEKKVKFDDGMQKAAKISNAQEKQVYYNKLLKDCKMTEKMKTKRAKEVIKLQQKAEKQATKETKKQAKKAKKEQKKASKKK